MKTYNSDLNGKKSFFSSIGVNTFLILLTILMFFVFSLLIKFNVLTIDDVAIKPSNIFEGKYIWTFLTSMFMHGGFFHLFVNVFSLFFLGTFLQRILGQKRYLWFYLISGLFAGIFFVLASLIPIPFFSEDFNLFAVGASGALFGLIGLMMLLTPNLPVYILFIPIPVKIKYAAPGMLILLWFISVTGNVPIGNTAHLGGLIAGLVYGLYLRNRYRNKVKALSKFFR